MARKLTDADKKKILAVYAETGNYRETARNFGLSDRTVRRICQETSEVSQLVAKKKEENTLDMIAYMDSRKHKAQGIIDDCLNILPEKLKETSAAQIVVILGVLIDKFVNNPIKNHLDEKRLEIELLKLENQIKNNQPEERIEDNFLDALNASATQIWSDGEKIENE